MKKCLVRETRQLTFGGSESVHFLKLLLMYSLSGPNAHERVMSEKHQHRWLAEACRMACGEGHFRAPQISVSYLGNLHAIHTLRRTQKDSSIPHIGFGGPGSMLAYKRNPTWLIDNG